MTRRTCWRRGAIGACAGMLAAVAGLAHAHQPSDAYLTLVVAEDRRVEARVDIALRDLDRDLTLDADGDGALRWGEVRARWGQIEALVDAAIRLNLDGQPCRRVASSTPALDAAGDGRHAVLRHTLRCEGVGPPQTATLDYRLFAERDPTHRGLVRLDGPSPGGSHSRVLVPGAPAVTVDLAPADARSGIARAADFFVEGLGHIAAGPDHLLFLATWLMVAVWRRRGDGWVPQAASASAWREAVRLVTAFTVAHSLTLGLAAAGVLAPPSRWVESLIAASVFVAALDNLRPFVPGPRWITVGAFGLVHGFGFAGPLQDLGLRGADLAWPLLGFNLGVEAGQLIVVAVLLPLALRWRAAGWYRRWVVRTGSAVVALLALAWTVERAVAIPLLSLGR